MSWTLAWLPGCGGGDPVENEMDEVVAIVKRHVEQNRERLQLGWIQEFPSAVKAYEVPKNPDFTHECYVWVNSGTSSKNRMSMPDGKPAKQVGLFIVGRNRRTGKWEITSGEGPIHVELKPW
ncbi:MAG: hypothetical protein HYU36_16295 [Planctomycetes bacterium]|nr:hypothetical protein [Planctomycetota bacterium]